MCVFVVLANNTEIHGARNIANPLSFAEIDLGARSIVAMHAINCNSIVAKIPPIQIMGGGELPP